MAEKEYIERGAVLGKAGEECHFDRGVFACHDFVSVDDIKSIPSADVVKVRHGRWIKHGNEKRCSLCSFIYYSNNDEWSYCPNCGAKMDGKEDEGK